MSDEYMLSLMTLLPMKGIQPDQIDSAVICSVVPPLNTVFEDLVKRCFSITPLLIGPGVRTGLRILYEPPRDVGADRVVDAVAAFHLYGGPVVIVDFGTATVFDAVSESGDYLGGALAPGVHSAAEARNREKYRTCNAIWIALRLLRTSSWDGPKIRARDGGIPKSYSYRRVGRYNSQGS